jgi:hypothetical protein
MLVSHNVRVFSPQNSFNQSDFIALVCDARKLHDRLIEDYSCAICTYPLTGGPAIKCHLEKGDPLVINKIMTQVKGRIFLRTMEDRPWCGIIMRVMRIRFRWSIQLLSKIRGH